MDWSQVTALTIPEGNVKQVSVNGVVLWKKAPSPSEYTQLEYIESTGTQWIDTGIATSNNDLGFMLEAMPLTSSDVYPMGSRATNGGTRFFGIRSQSSANFSYGWSTYLSASASQSYVDVRTTMSLNWLNSKKVTIGDDSADLSTVADVANGRNITLFGVNGQLLWKGRIYRAQISEGNEIIANFIPVMRNSDSKVGMRDTVTGQFFTNAGTGEFIASPRFVEYIEFDGNSWIDTGFTQQTCRIEFGVEFINHNNATQLMGFHVSNAGFWGIKFKGGMFYPYLDVNPYQYNDVILNLDATDTKKPHLTLTIGDASSSPVVGSTVQNNTTYVMGGVKYGSNINYNNFMKAHYNRIYNANNELIQDLRPCLDGNNVACMYDMVTGTYFYNQGTGEFIAGGAV